MADNLSNPDNPTFFPPPYQFRGELGKGGMGVVYRAFDPNRQEEVAIKFLPEGSVDQQVARRFQREVNQLASLSHQNIVAFFDAGTYGGRDFLVMEFVKGGNLSDVLLRRGGSLGWLETAKLFLQVAIGLGHIHDQGYVHRDFKPENLLVTLEGVPKITDFGLARKLEDRSRLTSDGTIVGTYSYLAPEQIMSSSVGPTADIYALGCCIYLTLTGQPVFKGGTEFSLLNSHLREIPVAPRTLMPEIPSELDALVFKMLKKAPEERPQSAQEVAKVLRSLLQKHTPSHSQHAQAIIGREDVFSVLDHRCELKPDTGFCCLFVAPNGLGRSVLIRQWVAAQRSKGTKVFTAVPSSQDLFPLTSVYRGLTGEEQPFVQALAQQGVACAVDLLVKALADYPEPAIIVADDFMRMSQTTNLILQDLCKRQPPPNRGWLFSCGLARAAGLSLWHGCERIELPPLDNSSMQEIASRILGGPMDESLADFVLKRSAGCVRKLRHNLCSLQAQNAIQIVQSEGPQIWGLSAAVKLASGAYESIVSDLERESSGRYRLLRTACFLQEPFSIQAAIVASGLSEQEGDLCVDLLMKQGLLEENWGGKGELFYVSSQEVKQLITQEVNERTSRRIHSKIVEQNICQSSAEVAIHEVRAGLGADALGSVERASVELERVGGYLESAELWHEIYPTLSSIETAEIRWKVCLKTAQALYVAGRLDEARECCSTVLTAKPPSQEGAALRYFQENFGLAVYLEYCSLDPGVTSARDFLARYPAHEPKAGPNNLFYCVAIASACEQTGDTAGLTASLDAAGQLSLQAQLVAPFAYYRLRSHGLRKVGRAKDALEMLAARAQYLCRTSPEDQNQLAKEKVLCLLQLERFEEANQLLEQQIRTCSISQLAVWEAEFWMLRGLNFRAVHRPDDALRSFQQATSVCPKGGNFEAQALFELGLQRLLMGEARPAELALRNCVSAAAGANYADPAGFCLGWLCMKNQRWTEAKDWFGQVVERQNLNVVQVDPAVCWDQLADVYQSESLLLQGLNQEALAHLDRLDSLLKPETFQAWSAAAIRSKCSGQALPEFGPSRLEQLRAYHPALVLLLAGELPKAVDTVATPKNVVESAQIVIDQSTESKPNEPLSNQDQPLKTSSQSAVEQASQTPAVSDPDLSKLGLVPATVTAAKGSDLSKPSSSKSEPPSRPDVVPAKPSSGIGPKLLAVGLASCTLIAGLLMVGKSLLKPKSAVSNTPSPIASASQVEARLVIDTVPDKAELVLFDPSGKEVCRGVAPLTCPRLLLEGDYCVNTSRPGFENGQFHFKGGADVETKTFELKEAMCRLRLHFEPTPLNLTIDSEKPITIDSGTFEKELRVGSHQLKAAKPGYLAWTKTIELKATSVLELPDIVLVAEQGELKLSLEPKAVRIVVDNKEVGVTPGEGAKAGKWESRLKPGKHSIRVTKDGYETQEVSVKLEAGKELKKSISLKKIELPPEPTRPVYQDPPPRPVYNDPPPYNPPPPRPITRPDDV